MNWIKVTDALPEEGENVLAWIGGQWVDVRFSSGKFYPYGVDLPKLLGITHWMRITPPEE